MQLTYQKMLERDILIDKKVAQNYFNLDKVVNLLELLLKTFLNWPWITLTDPNWLKAISLQQKLEFLRFCYIVNFLRSLIFQGTKIEKIFITAMYTVNSAKFKNVVDGYV